MKKLLTGLLVLSATFVAVGCESGSNGDNNNDDVSTVDSIIESAMKRVLLSGDLNSITTDFDLVSTVVYEENSFDVEWTSENTSVVQISEDNKKANITRPTFGTEDVTLSITAEITDGDEVASKEFNLTVLAETIDANESTTISDLHTTIADLTEVSVTGTVFGIDYQGYFIADSTGTTYVFEKDGYDVKEGDVVTVTGTKDTFYGMVQVKEVTDTVVSDATKTTLTATETNISSLPTSDIDSTLYSSLIKVTGKLESVSGGFYIDGARVFAEGTEDLSSYVGKNVTLTGILKSYHTSNEYWQMVFSGGSQQSIEVIETPAEDIIAAITETLKKENQTVTGDFTLPEFVENTSITYAVATGTEVIAITGNNVTVTPAETDTVATVDAAFTVNGQITTVVISITVTGVPVGEDWTPIDPDAVIPVTPESPDGDDSEEDTTPEAPESQVVAEFDFDFSENNDQEDRYYSFFTDVTEMHVTINNYDGIRMGGSSSSKTGEFHTNIEYNGVNSIDFLAQGWINDTVILTATCSTSGATGSFTTVSNGSDYEIENASEYTINFDKECIGVITFDTSQSSDKRVIIYGMTFNG